MFFLRHASPLSVQQDAVCSAFVEGDGRCKNGFPQSTACCPYRDPTDRNRWNVDRGPVCTWDEIPERFSAAQKEGE